MPRSLTTIPTLEYLSEYPKTAQSRAGSNTISNCTYEQKETGTIPTENVRRSSSIRIRPTWSRWRTGPPGLYRASPRGTTISNVINSRASSRRTRSVSAPATTLTFTDPVVSRRPSRPAVSRAEQHDQRSVSAHRGDWLLNQLIALPSQTLTSRISSRSVTHHRPRIPANTTSTKFNSRDTPSYISQRLAPTGTREFSKLGRPLMVGQPVTGPGAPAGTTVASTFPVRRSRSPVMPRPAPPSRQHSASALSLRRTDVPPQPDSHR